MTPWKAKQSESLVDQLVPAPTLIPIISRIHALLRQPAGQAPRVMLSEFPNCVGWNEKNYLTDIDDRVVVFVAYGSLSFANIIVSRRACPSFSVGIELLREADKLGMQRLLDIALPFEGAFFATSR